MAAKNVHFKQAAVPNYWVLVSRSCSSTSLSRGSFLKLDAKNPHLKQAKLLLLGAAYCLLAAVAAAKV